MSQRRRPAGTADPATDFTWLDDLGDDAPPAPPAEPAAVAPCDIAEATGTPRARGVFPDRHRVGRHRGRCCISGRCLLGGLRVRLSSAGWRSTAVVGAGALRESRSMNATDASAVKRDQREAWLR